MLPATPGLVLCCGSEGNGGVGVGGRMPGVHGVVGVWVSPLTPDAAPTEAYTAACPPPVYPGRLTNQLHLVLEATHPKMLLQPDA